MDAVMRPVDTLADRGRREIGRALRAVVGAFRIREERLRDIPAREALLDRAFGSERFTKTCERLREGRFAADELSFVATAGTSVVGTLRFWSIEAGRRPALMLGPLAVHADYRSSGIGRALIEHGLRRARKLSHGGVLLVGDAPYYAKFGFSAETVAGLTLPGPVDQARFLGLDLVPGAMTGASGRVVGAGRLVERREIEALRLAA